MIKTSERHRNITVAVPPGIPVRRIRDHVLGDLIVLKFSKITEYRGGKLATRHTVLARGVCSLVCLFIVLNFQSVANILKSGFLASLFGGNLNISGKTLGLPGQQLAGAVWMLPPQGCVLNLGFCPVYVIQVSCVALQASSPVISCRMERRKSGVFKGTQESVLDLPM